MEIKMKPNFENGNMNKMILMGVVLVVAIALLSQSVVIVNTGAKGIILRFGSAVSVKDAGLSFKIPFIETVRMIEVREQNTQRTFTVSSKDIQTIDVTINIQYAITGDILDLYSKFGLDYRQRLIEPRISESINAVVARYTIEEFIEKRTLLAIELLNELQTDFENYGITVGASSIIEHDFSEEFDKSIEAKKIAEQEALRARNELEKVKYEAQAEIEKAQGISEANKIVQNSLTEKLIQQKMIDKWDGKLPVYQGGNGSPLFNISPTK
jgi:regulator of protease activity HflC (stomatin/prohibitin superfamily)